MIRTRYQWARRFWAIVAAMLVMSFAGAAWAQDTDDDLIKKRGRRPGVLNRKNVDKKDTGKKDTKPSSKTPEGNDINNPLADEVIEVEKNFDPPLGDDRSIPDTQKVTVDFRKAELENVVKIYSKWMKKNFIIADSLKAGKKITIIAPKQVTVREAYRAFLTSLAMNGLTITPHGAFLKIVDSNNAMKGDTAIKRGKAGLPGGDVMETRIVPIEHVSYQDVENVLKNLKSKDGNIFSYGPTNTLIITDYGGAMRRMFKVITFLDQPTGADKIHLYQVQFADAEDLASKIKEIFDTDSRSSSSSSKKKGKKKSDSSSETDVQITKIISDENTNQLIIIANDRSYRRIVELIEKLDVETNAGRIWVYPLQHADAEELSGVLSGLTNNRNNRRSSSSSSSRSNRSGNRSSSSGSSSGGAALLSGDVQVTADSASNSLIIVASFKDYVALKTVVDQLDRRRKQVFVEAAIMEVSLNSNRKFGIGMNTGFPQEFGFIPQSAAEEVGNTGLVVTQSNYPGIAELGSIVGGSDGLGLGILGPSVEIPGFGVDLPAFLFFLEANQIDQDVNILSTPSLLTLNNEEAEISVGERVPFFTGGLGGGGGLGNLTGLLGAAGGANGANNALGGLGGLGGLGALGGLGGFGGSNVQYEDVALTLRIVPQINASGGVRLEVDMTVDELKPGAGDTLTPTRTTRKLKNVVVADDQQTIVIGGLMRDVENEGTIKVPFLGDIPILGVLFRRTDRTVAKQNLVLMLTPYIIDSEADIRRITEEKRRQREEFIELFGSKTKEYMWKIDYRKKRGLLEEINQKLKMAEAEDSARREAYGDPKSKGKDKNAAPKTGAGDKTTPAGGTKKDDIVVQPEKKEG